MYNFKTTVEQNFLTHYRNQATFTPKLLKEFLESDETRELKEHITKILHDDPLFARDCRSLSVDAYQELNFKRWKKLVEYDFVENNCFYKAMNRVRVLMEILDTYDQGLSNRYFLSTGVFCLAILTMGTERHHNLMQKCIDNEIVGCFCLTELGHGSNTRDIETECHFKDGHFVLHTPTISAVKCWAGNLSYSATHAIVYAQLYINGECKGLHAFCLQIRDLLTLKPLPGITIGDVGEKAGEWNGVENGWMKFDNHEIQLDCLLNRASDVTESGQFIQKSLNPQQQRFNTMGTISFGRITLIGKAALAMQLSAVIAIRYSAVRTHFIHDDSKEELSILEFPMQQRRVIPILAAAVAYKIFYNKFFQHYVDYLDSIMPNSNSSDIDLKEATVREIHALSCAAKAVTTKEAVEAISEARAACGGQGCLKYSRLIDLYEAFESSRTYEGENNVLLQHAAHILLSVVDEPTSKAPSPIGSFAVLQQTPQKFHHWSDDIVDDVMNAYRWLICYYAKETKLKVEALMKSGMNETTARSAAFHDYSQMLATAYVEYTIIKYFHEAIGGADAGLQEVLTKILKIYATSTIQKYSATLYYGDYTNDKAWKNKLNDSLTMAISKLMSDAISVCDVIAPDDFLLHSHLATEDGQIQEHLWEQFKKRANLRPRWWRDLVEFLKKDTE